MTARSLCAASLSLLLSACSSATTTGEPAGVTDVAEAGAHADASPSPSPEVDATLGSDGKTGDELSDSELEITIQAPEPDEVFTYGDDLPFRATIAPSDLPPEGLSYHVESDLDGPLDEGELDAWSLELTLSGLSHGAHSLTLSVVDEEAREYLESVPVVINRPPTGETLVSISPQTPVSTDALQALITQSAVDPEGEEVSYSFAWFVDDLPAGIAAATVPAQETERGQVWRVEAHPTDGYALGPPAQASVTILNAPPSLGAVSILPSAGDTTTEFSCNYEGYDDPEGSDEAVLYRWLLNGELIDGQTGDTLPSAETVKGDEVQCSVTPQDDEGSGATLVSEIALVLDAPPSVTSASLEPPAGDRTTLFTCVAGETADLDGDDLSLITRWRVNDEELPGTTSSTSEGISLTKGDILQCELVPVAAELEGSALLSNSVTIDNAAPIAGAVIMSPNPASELSVVSCIVGDSSDPDDESVSLTYVWKVNGVIVAGETSYTLDGEHFNKGDEVLCEALAFDGEAYSAPEASKVVVQVINTPPFLSTATLTPSEGAVTSTFTCSAGASEDPDPGDSVSVATLWFHQGVAVAGGTGETLIPADFGLGPGELSCTLTPNDGESDGIAVTSNAAEIINAAPSLESLSLGPQPASSSDTLVCTPEGVADADGDEVELHYEWSVAGVTLPDESGPTLSPEHFAKGDLVVCIATPDDGIEEGSPVPSNSLIITNSAPTLSGATISPTVGGKLTSFTCEPEGANDPDAGDEESLVFVTRWYIDGALIPGAESPSFVPGNQIETDATLSCSVTPYDLQSYGEEKTSGQALITNLAPLLESVVLNPADGGLYCVPQGLTDPDEDEVTPRFAWLVNGLIVTEADEAFFNLAGLEPESEVRCVVTPYDGSVEGQPKTSPPYLSNNSSPGPPEVSLGPPGAKAGESLICEALSLDPDDDPLTYSYTWTLNGSPQPAYTQAELPAGVSAPCDTWTCEVVASDGTHESAPGSASLTVGPEGAADSSGYTWFGHHSAPADAGAADIETKNTFFSSERVATQITPDPSAFPITLTHVRFYGHPGTYEIDLMSDAGEPIISLASGTHEVTNSGMQIATLDVPLTLNGPLTIWVALNGTQDLWVASADTDGQATQNLVYGCFGSEILGCFTPPSWDPYEHFDFIGDAWASWGDIIADVGFISDGEAASCEE